MKKILICAPVKQKEHIFKEYIESLDRLIVPKDCEIHRAFYLHDCEELIKYINPPDVVFINNDTSKYKTQGTVHVWEDDNFSQVVFMKNELIKYAIDNNFDYWFLVDSDLILNPHTLERLVECDKDICAEIFWTEYAEGSGLLTPNCWDFDAMGFDNLSGGLRKYQMRGLHKTGGTGACMLVKVPVFKSGVNYSKLYNVSFSNWEDRAFSIRAVAHGYELYIDTTLPARHLYKESDYENYLKYKQRKGF